jgi:hypothetical protein
MSVLYLCFQFFIFVSCSLFSGVFVVLPTRGATRYCIYYTSRVAEEPSTYSRNASRLSISAQLLSAFRLFAAVISRSSQSLVKVVSR